MNNDINNHERQRQPNVQRTRRHRKRRPVFIFFATLMVILFVFAIVAAPIMLNALNNGSPTLFGIPLPNSNETKSSDGNNSGGFFSNIFTQKSDVILNVAIMGVDEEETRTDTIMILHFNSATNKINLLSIPRDTKVTMPEERVEVLLAEDRYVPKGGVMKINEVHSFAGKERSNEYSVLQFEELLGIDIDYYALVNLDAFEYIVDAIGGVELTVPKGGLYYFDPTQNLRINLDEGTYTMTGKQAEGFVRIRSAYADQDLGRIRAQQTFMKAFLKQALSKENIVNNLLDYVSAALKYVKTDFGLDDITKHIKYIKALNPENMEFATLPGESDYAGGKWYYIHDPVATNDLVQRLFFQSGIVPEEEPDSKEKKIRVLNGGSVNGLASTVQDRLTAEGYNIVGIGNHNGDRIDATRIIVAAAGQGKDLVRHFEKAEIIIDSSQLESGVDILIILGQSEQ